MKKRSNIFQILIIVILYFTPIILLAQDNHFKIAGQYRVRPEFRKGYKTLSADTSTAAFFIAQRARLIFEFKKNNITAYSSIQDVRTWGDEEQLKDMAGLSVNELWVELGLKKGLSVKMGRQELVYDDHRLLGNLDWANNTRSHDALVIKYANPNHKFYGHIGGAFNQNGEPLTGTVYNLKNYKYLSYAWFKKELSDQGAYLSATAIINGSNSTVASSPASKASFTIGPLLNYQKNKFKGIAGAYYQTGKTSENLQLNAYMVNLYAGLYNKIIVGTGIDYLSGSRYSTPSAQSHSFSTLFATNHKFYGYMDYFINIPGDTKQRGLIDPYIRLGKQNKNLTTTLDIHYFSLAHKYDPDVAASLGTEADLLIEYKPSPEINLQAGYSMMFATKNMEVIKGGNKDRYQGWAFIMLKISPTFFTHEIKN